MTQPDEWRGCYDGGWKGAIVPEAFAHPAKFSRALIHRIYAHALEQVWLKAGDMVLDPFGGVALGALHAMWYGLTWIGVELEPKFVTLAEQNLALWQRKYGHKDGWGSARIVQGDSRQLAELIADADCCIGSPPFSTPGCQPGGNMPSTPVRSKQRAMGLEKKAGLEYGSTPGQLGAMPEGRFEAVVSSPPYEGSLDAKGDGIDWTKAQRGGHSKTSGTPRTLSRGAIADGYGTGLENTGNLTGDTFWSAAREILEQCHAVLRPGGHAIWVTKDFVRKNQRVPFSDQWAALCESVGFRLVCRHRAMLVEQHGVQGGMFGEDRVIGSERKSFFRRLAERKGSPRIDHEDVLCFGRVPPTPAGEQT